MKPLVLCLLLLTPPAFVNAAPVATRQSARTWPTLTRAENQGWQVMFVQYLLRHRGFYRGKVDYDFGPRTECAVRAFQRSKGLKVDGIVGAQTWEKLIVPLQRGSRGDAVRAIQGFFGYAAAESGDGKYSTSGDANGVFGAATEKVVRLSQKESGLKVDGVVGAQTWCELVGGNVAGTPQ